MHKISSFGLYDIDKDKADTKLLCRQWINKTTIDCLFLQFSIDFNQCKYNVLYGITINEANYFSEKNCFFSQFNSEYLFCCGIMDFIKCYKFNITNFHTIKEFSIKINGNNSYLIIKCNINYITLFFMNSDNNNNSVYEYYIYLPTFQNIDYEIYNHLDENMPIKELDKLRNLFAVKTNKYFFEIKKPINTYGYFILNNETLSPKTQINNNDYILSFISTNINISNNIKKIFKYIVSVEEEEAYKVECQISITFKICYHSCDKCYLDIFDSNNTHHNCINCRENFYPSPDNKSNCYSIEEKQINWYFDSNISEFRICHEECLSCSGSDKFNCLSCNNGSYLDNNTCTSNCSEGYFPIKIEIDSNTYFNCNECYKNCKTCLKKEMMKK